MAIVTLGGGVASIRGSIGGTTFSANRGGPYARNRTVPVNPNTPAQQDVRALVSQLTSLWYNTLTVAQRQSWDDYAENVPLPNSLGYPRNVGGLAMYIRSNVPRLHANPTSLPRVDTGPTIFNLGDYTAPSFGQISAATSICPVTFGDTDGWCDEDEAGMIVQASRGKNASINYFKGPYRVGGQILGNSTTPPTSPQNVTCPFTYQVGQRVFLRAQVSRADGRLSADFRYPTSVGS